MDGTIQISEENAQIALDQLLDYYGIDLAFVNDGEVDLINAACLKVKQALMIGQLAFDFSDGTVVIKQELFKPIEGVENPLVYKEAMAEYKIKMPADGSSFEKCYTMLGLMCGETIGIMGKMKGRDFGVTEALGQLFLQI